MLAAASCHVPASDFTTDNPRAAEPSEITPFKLFEAAVVFVPDKFRVMPPVVVPPVILPPIVITFEELLLIV